MQSDALAEVDSSIIEGLPVPATDQYEDGDTQRTMYSQPKLQVVLQVNANVCAGCDRHESGPQLSVVNPDLYVLAVKEHI